MMDFNSVKEQIYSALKGKIVDEARSFQPSYSNEIMIAPLPKTFKMPNLVIYDGRGHLNEHLDIFRS